MGTRYIANQSMYNIVFTLHGLIMIFFLVMPSLFSGFGNYFMPLYLGTSEIAYPRVNNLALLLLPIAFMVAASSIITEYGYGTG